MRKVVNNRLSINVVPLSTSAPASPSFYYFIRLGGDISSFYCVVDKIEKMVNALVKRS